MLCVPYVFFFIHVYFSCKTNASLMGPNSLKRLGYANSELRWCGCYNCQASRFISPNEFILVNLNLSKRLCGSRAVCAVLHVGASGWKFQISITCYVHVAEVKSRL